MRTIQLTCSRCNATMFLEKNRNFSRLSCPYCGGSTELIVESDRVKVAEILADTERMSMELSYKKHRDHMSMDQAMQKARVILICIATVIVLCLIGFAVARDSDRIRVPFSSRDLNGKRYQDAQAMLIDAGFTDIVTIPQKDLWDGFLHNDQGNIGKVAQVTINGDERFREHDSFDKDSKIRIWYHTYP